jgi:DNA-binding transcriptional ArsR family regulator
MNLESNSGVGALAGTFAALSDPHRLAIVERLIAEGEKTVGELAAPFEISGPAISRHLSVLESAGLIERRVERQWRICRIRQEALRAVEDWVERQRRFWNASLGRLEQHLEQSAEKENEGNEQ